MKYLFKNLIFFLIIVSFPCGLNAEIKNYECRYYVKKLKRYHVNRVSLDTWAMNGKVQNITPFIKENKIRSGSLVKYKNAFMITIDQKPLSNEYHLISQIEGELKYLIEFTVYNILGKTLEEKKQITHREHLNGDCRNTN